MPIATSPLLAIKLSRQRHRAILLSPGVLQTPNFHRNAPWISVTACFYKKGQRVSEWAGPVHAAPLPPSRLAEAAALAARITAEELGGTFWADPPPDAALGNGRIIIQAAPDTALTATMLARALASANSSQNIVILAHPATRLPPHARFCTLLTTPVDPWPLLKGAAALYAPPGHYMNHLAAFAGCAPAPPRHAATCLLHITRYASPFTGQPIGCEAALDIVAEWRRITRANRDVGALTGMSFWKRQRMGRFFHAGNAAPPHCRTASAALRAARGRAIAAWSYRIPHGLAENPAARLIRVEDGFIRSRGPGSFFLSPCSIIADTSGIYYDASRPSDLETLLLGTRFTPALLARAQRLIDLLIRHGITTCGAGTVALVLPDAGGRARILVPGQVADDLSVRLGGAGGAGNLDLLARVRAANPNAFIIYKPHPDIEAGHRAGAIPDTAARRHADLIIRGVPMAALIGAVDEVHTLTSLAGFEALLARRHVVVHGQPFYAGWGLTEDLAPLPSRTRRLTIEELVAGVLLLYPRYLDPVTELPCTAEILAERLADPGTWQTTRLRRVRGWQGMIMKRLGVT